MGVIPQSNDYRSTLTLYEAVVPLPADRHLTDLYTTSLVALINSCGFGWKAIERLEYYSNSDLLLGTVLLAGCIRYRHESRPSR